MLPLKIFPGNCSGRLVSDDCEERIAKVSKRIMEVLSAFSEKRACHVTIGSRRELKTYAVMKKAEDILMIHKEELLVRRFFFSSGRRKDGRQLRRDVIVYFQWPRWRTTRGGDLRQLRRDVMIAEI